MQKIKDNWKFIVLVILLMFFLKTLKELSLNGRYIPSTDLKTIFDTRTGKAYILVPDGKGNKLKEKGKND